MSFEIARYSCLDGHKFGSMFPLQFSSFVKNAGQDNRKHGPNGYQETYGACQARLHNEEDQHEDHGSDGDFPVS